MRNTRPNTPDVELPGGGKRIKAVADNHFDRRRDMTHVAFVGGLPGWKWKTTDPVVITDWNSDGVPTGKALGFEPGEGSW